jgi:hypothetical protein
MRKIVCLAMLICLGSAVTKLYPNPSEKNFEGEWGWHKGFDFVIHLHQNGNSVTGYHSGVTKDARRTDTALDGEDPPSITGTAKGDTAIVEVHSTFSDAALMVRLTLHDRSLDWKVTEVKKDGYRVIPDKATLYKEHWDKKKGWVRDHP